MAGPVTELLAPSEEHPAGWADVADVNGEKYLGFLQGTGDDGKKKAASDRRVGLQLVKQIGKGEVDLLKLQRAAALTAGFVALASTWATLN